MGYEDILQSIPVSEYKDRLARTKQRMEQEGLEGLLVYSDSARMSNVRWLADYRAFDGVFPYPAMVFVPLIGDPILFAEGSLVGYASDKTWFDDTRGIRQELGIKAKPFGYTNAELQRMAEGEFVFPHVFGADTKSFDIMVQSGVNAEKWFLAYPTDKVIQKGETILIDIGCRFNDYSSDMARGVGYGDMSPAQEKLLNTCLKAWEEGMAALRPGMTGKEADVAANRVMAEAGYVHFAGEGRGCAHSTGMDPEEEIPTIGPNSDDVLQENQTFCFEITLMEPGVGGTRVEDTVVLRKDGPESLTNFPRMNRW